MALHPLEVGRRGSIERVVEPLEVIVGAVKARRLWGARSTALSGGGVARTTLDFYSDAPGSYSRTLDETGIHVVTAGRRAERVRVLGVDGSSRRFSTPYGSLALATVALTYGPLPLLDYPPLGYDYPIRCEPAQPFIAAYAALGVRHELVATESPAGYPYEPPPLDGSEGRGGYTLADLEDEDRTRLETLGLRVAVREAREGDVVLLDGPLYQRPWAQEVRRSPHLRDDWRVLTRERVEVLEEGAGGRVAVVGSVKRLGRSRLLVRVHDAVCDRLGLDAVPPQDNDQAEIIQLASLYVEENGLSGLRPLLLGPLLLRPPDELKSEFGVDVPEIVYSYVVVPRLPYRGSLDVPCGVFRLEVLKEVYDSEGLDAFFRALSEGVTQGPQLPPAQAFADARCRRTSRALFELLCRLALAEGLELSRETLLEYYNRAGEEYAE
jgi:hypothetical protein